MSPSEELARRIALQLRNRGHSAYLVGGCVRDLLLGLPPKDFDVATSATPAEVAQLYPAAQLVGAHFGVVLVSEDMASVEVATYRRDHDYRDGRHPSEVTFEREPKNDVLRRDFTINGLLLDVESGEVLDYVGGKEDLRLQMVRAIGNPEKRFREDHLRLLRAVRLAAKLKFDIESETEAAIVRLHPIIQIVSEERIREELVRILTEGQAKRGMELLDRTGLLAELIPQAATARSDAEAWRRTLTMLENMERPTASLGMAILLRELTATAAAGILSRLRFSNEEIRRTELLLENLPLLGRVRQMRESELKRILRLPRFDELLELQRLFSIASGEHSDEHAYMVRRRRELTESDIWPPKLVNGTDLLAIGASAGPALGKVLHAIEDAQLNGEIHTREEALDMARRLIRRP